MVIAYPTIEQQVRETLVQFLRTIPVRKRLWARADSGIVRFWLETEPISDAQEEHLYRANRLIYEHIPDARFDFIVMNPAIFDDPAYEFTPPRGAEEIALG